MSKVTNIRGIPVFGDPIDNAVDQMEQCIMPSANYVALMADHHLGYSMAIGGVAAYDDMISPSCVGYDIGCGNKAVRVNAGAHGVRERISEIMDTIFDELEFGIGTKNYHGSLEPVHLFNQHPEGVNVLRDIEKIKPPRAGTMFNLANDQFGTLGGGNHYVDIMTDEQDRVWIGVHCGSRGLGHTIASWFLGLAGVTDNPMAEPALFHVDSWEGIQYINAMRLAGDYAMANRNWIVQHVVDLMGWKEEETVHNHHNYAWEENHFGKDMWVIRKGATPAFPGQRGFIGGSMGDNAVIVEGVESEDSAVAMYSTVHGAGRAMSRGDARGKIKNGVVKKEAKVTSKMMTDWLKDFGVEVRGGDVDEAPQAYKRLDEVLAAQSDTIKVLHTLKPIGVAMAPPMKRKW